MSVPTTRTEFGEYCLRALGDGVIQINVSSEQVSDRIDEALYTYQQRHMDAVVKNYLKHEISPSVMRFTTGDAGNFAVGEVLVGQTSNTYGEVVDAPFQDANTLTFIVTNGPVAALETGPPNFTVPEGQGTFAEGETVQGRRSGATAVIATSDANTNFLAIELGDFDNKYFTVPDALISVTKIFAPFDSRISADILFDPQSQFNISLLSNFTSNSIVPYVIGRQYQQLLNDTFRGRPGTRFQRHMNRLFVDVNWYTTFRPKQFIVVEGYHTIDPNDFPDVWGDRWLQRYCIALIKRQWASNLIKYTGIALPGGVMIDGKTMMIDAKQEVADLEKELKDTYELPPEFIVG
jgi:hypothetical protein